MIHAMNGLRLIVGKQRQFTRKSTIQARRFSWPALIRSRG
jgi:hypothetical protein